MKPEPITGMLPPELEAWLAARGDPPFRVHQIFDWIYRKRASSYAQMRNLPESLRNALSDCHPLRSLTVARQQGSQDTTRKFLFRLSDGRYIESVVIPANPALYGRKSDRHTLCVSTQVGCAMDCKFCASGLNGLTRNLETHEIVEQILEAERLAAVRMDNLVFMGMGEPLANMTNFLRAVSILNAEWGVGIGARSITVSTSGLVPQIRQLAELPLQIRLAVSLHGATDAVRERIMPINRKYPLGSLFEALRYYSMLKKQMITFEYILIEGMNDSVEQAAVLAQRARGLSAKVNLIPYNSVDGLYWKRPSEAQQDRFLDVLRAHRVTATLRREKGHDIDAACGQLRLKEEQSLPDLLSKPA
ncbi:MAG: 23S rRNA (adenine(2503)-C(2))-methyltransferase RlmN [Verrucomicrobiales bacterium]